jgi:hypothetical protein
VTGVRTGAASRIREIDAGLDAPLRIHPDWADRWDWLIQGTTWRGAAGDFDLGLSGGQPVGAVLDRWRSLQRTLRTGGIVHSRQLHRAAVRIHAQATQGLAILDGFDGHHTAGSDLALTVSVADCIPVSIVDPVARTVTLLHAGWRGVAAGIIERGITIASRAANGATARLHVHFGPAICGECYEVGPEVHEQLGLPVPASPGPVDLREVGVARAVGAGALNAAITVSELCTRCESGRPFYSHRAGEAGRQMAVLGIRTG